jgi:hypothetical protein
LYHVAMETSLRRIQAHDADLSNYLHELEVRTKMLNVYYGRDCAQYAKILCTAATPSKTHETQDKSVVDSSENRIGSNMFYSVPMFELDCLFQLYTESMTPANHRDMPLRRSSRKRKRVHKMNL